MPSLGINTLAAIPSPPKCNTLLKTAETLFSFIYSLLATHFLLKSLLSFSLVKV